MSGLLHYDTYQGEAGTVPDPAVWTARSGNYRPGVQAYDQAHAVLDGNGHLAVTAERTPTGFASARIDTRGKLSLTPPVRIRASIQMPPGGQGIVPAFWTLGDNMPGGGSDWPECGEIDIVEWPSNHPVQDSKHCAGRYAAITIHGPSDAAPNTDRPLFRADTKGQPIRAMGKSALDDGFHLYDLTWKPDRMIFALDGAVVWDLKQADYEAAGGDWTPFTGAWPHYLVLQVAVNTGMTPNVTDTAPFPATMLVDWLRVEQL